MHFYATPSAAPQLPPERCGGGFRSQKRFMWSFPCRCCDLSPVSGRTRPHALGWNYATEVWSGQSYRDENITRRTSLLGLVVSGRNDASTINHQNRPSHSICGAFWSKSFSQIVYDGLRNQRDQCALVWAFFRKPCANRNASTFTKQKAIMEITTIATLFPLINLKTKAFWDYSA